MKNRWKYLRKLYAVLLLAAISVSVLPVQLLHSHEWEHVLTSRDFADSNHYSAGHQAFCLVCSSVAAQHYIAPANWDMPVYAVPFFCEIIWPEHSLPALRLSMSLRGPPAC